MAWLAAAGTPEHKAKFPLPSYDARLAGWIQLQTVEGSTALFDQERALRPRVTLDPCIALERVDTVGTAGLLL